jgi:TonB family protein
LRLLALLLVFVLSVWEPVQAVLAQSPAPSHSTVRPDPEHPIAPTKFPHTSIRLGETGTTRLRFTVLPDGSVAADSIVLEATSGVLRLDHAAVADARTWRFMPATENGDPVAAEWSRDVQFARSWPETLDPANPLQLPAYPSDALARGEQGDVTVRFDVGPDGRVLPQDDQWDYFYITGPIRIIKGSGHETLDKSVLAAARNWRFLPPNANGEPIGGWMVVRVSFTLASVTAPVVAVEIVTASTDRGDP